LAAATVEANQGLLLGTEDIELIAIQDPFVHADTTAMRAPTTDFVVMEVMATYQHNNTLKYQSTKDWHF